VWLRDYLGQHRPVLSTDVIADASAAGIGYSALYKARIELCVRLERVPGGPGARYWWT